MRRHVLTAGEPFTFECGKKLEGIRIVYHTSDRDYTPGEKVVWICHALTGNSNPEDWWPQMVGAGKLIDPEKYYVVCAAMLCSPYGECGPASIDPSTGRPYFLSFPRTTVRDITAADILVRKHLGINKIDLLIGPSIGGFQAVEWAVMEPSVIERAVFLATDVRVAPFLTAFNESQRLALLADQSFGEAASLDGGRAGLECARSIALISYRTFDGYNLTQAEQEDDTIFADRAASYQRYQGVKLVRRAFDAYSYYYLSLALDSMNVGRGRGGVAAALATIEAKCYVICITSDVLFPPDRCRAAAEAIPFSEYWEINSIFGHDGFLIENDQLTGILSDIDFFK